MLKIKKIGSKLKYLINSMYYLKDSISKNTYPYKLIGEKIYHLESGKIVLYKILGQQNNNEISLKNLLNNKKFIEKFHPADAIRLGAMAFEEIISNLNHAERQVKFDQIKNTMLNSAHDVYPKREPSLHELQNITSDHTTNEDYLDIAVMRNSYPCKLVGGKTDRKQIRTIITYIIWGKRDGHEKSLKHLINDKELIQKFHPTEAIKFGFIFSGDSLFSHSDPANKENNVFIAKNGVKNDI